MSKAVPGAVDYGLLGALSLIWGSAFLLSKIAVADFPPVTLTAVRQMIALAAFAAVATVFRTRWFRPTRREHVLIMVAAVTGIVIPFTLINWGVAVVDSGLAAILMGFMPLGVLVLAHLYTHDEKLTWPKLAGVVIGLLGLVVLFWPSVVAGFGQDVWRQLALLGAALSYAVNALAVKQLVHRPPVAFFVYSTLWSVLLSGALALALESPPAAMPGSGALAALAALGIVPTVIGAFLMFSIIVRQGAGFFGQINLLVPVAGVLIGAVFAGERPGWNAMAALAIIVSGVIVARLDPAGRSDPIKERANP